MSRYDPQTGRWSFDTGDRDTAESLGFLVLIGVIGAAVLAVAFGAISLVLSAF